MPAKSRPYHHGDLRRALMDALLELATEHGSTSGITLREIARKAGVSHNAPYRHFEDKADVLAAVAEEGFHSLAEAMRSSREDIDDPQQRFVATGLAFLGFARDNPGHVAAMWSPELAKARTPTLQRTANEAFQYAKHLAADAGITDLDRARRSGTVVWAFVYGLASLTTGGQIPRSVSGTPESLAILGLHTLYRSLRADR